MMKKIAILGSTGSIGTQTLEVVRYNKDIQVTALAAGSNVKLWRNKSVSLSPGWPVSGMRRRQRNCGPR